MAAAPQLPFVSEEEYLRTEYEPHCEYVDGVLEPKALPGRSHSILHGFLIGILVSFCESHRIYICPDLRLRIRRGRHRLPDIAIMPDTYLTDSSVGPLAVIEILSAADPMRTTRVRIQDLHSIGAEWAVVADPDDRVLFVSGPDRLLREIPAPRILRLPLPDRPELIIDFDALFAKLPAEPEDDL